MRQAKPLLSCLAILATTVCATAAVATPLEQSCRFVATLGGNDADGVGPLMDELAARWPEANRVGAVASLRTMLGELQFAGGSVYQIGQLGDDLEEHLVMLRLGDGELAGARLVYEWTPEGLTLTTMAFQRKYTDLISTPMLQPPEALTCP